MKSWISKTWLGVKTDIDVDTRKKTMHIGDYCNLTFLEFGLYCMGAQKHNFPDPSLLTLLEYTFRVNEQVS